MTETTNPNPTTNPTPSSAPTPGQGSTHQPGVRRLVRRRDGMIGGVAAGMADYLNVDVSIVRLGFLALTFVGGSGPLLYVVSWIIVPQADQAAMPMVPPPPVADEAAWPQPPMPTADVSPEATA